MEAATLTTPAEAVEDRTEEIQARMHESLSGQAILMLGSANSIMQLSRLPVGHGVAKSKVKSGRVDLHPLKRLRTTLAYLGIAMFGTEDERAGYRREVNRAHKPVCSEPGDEVEYNAFDPELQLWVAACLVYGSEQASELQGSEPLPDDEDGEAFLRYAARFGTTLQVPEEMWFANREEFDSYWERESAKIEMDDVTRRYLQDLAQIKFMPAPVRWLLGGYNEFITVGFLPPEFQAELGLPWSKRRQRLHDRVTKLIMKVHMRMPGPVRRFPFNFYLWDTRRRLRRGKAVV